MPRSDLFHLQPRGVYISKYISTASVTWSSIILFARCFFFDNYGLYSYEMIFLPFCTVIFVPDACSKGIYYLIVNQGLRQSIELLLLEFVLRESKTNVTGP